MRLFSQWGITTNNNSVLYRYLEVLNNLSMSSGHLRDVEFFFVVMFDLIWSNLNPHIQKYLWP